MKYGSLVFKEETFAMIQYYLEVNEVFEDYAHKNVLDMLSENMLRAIIIDSENMPEDVVQINATVTVRFGTDHIKNLWLVPPKEADLKKDKISVISTLGASIIGLSEGDSVGFGLPGNLLKLNIERVQPNGEKFGNMAPRNNIEIQKQRENKNLLTLNI